jgi:hypothetical protein
MSSPNLRAVNHIGGAVRFLPIMRQEPFGRSRTHGRKIGIVGGD